MGNKMAIGDMRGILMNPDKRLVLLLLPQMDEILREYAIAHLVDSGHSREKL